MKVQDVSLYIVAHSNVTLKEYMQGEPGIFSHVRKVNSAFCNLIQAQRKLLRTPDPLSHVCKTVWARD